MSELKKIKKILEKNKEKSFVKRVLAPDKFPSIDLGDGSTASHRMAWTESDGKYYVFPTILYDGNKLTEYPWQEAFEHARKSGNVIEFDNPDEADWFSKSYKKVWTHAEE